MKFILPVSRRIFGIFMIPLLYGRYSFVLFLPVFFIDSVENDVFYIWFLYYITFSILMGNLGGMEYWTKLIQWVFKVQYEIIGHWGYMHDLYSRPILKVRNKQYNLLISAMGGNIYEEEEIIRRKAIIYWFII